MTKAVTKKITDASIRAAFKKEVRYLYDSRRVEFHINAARTGGTFYDVVYKGKKRQRTKLAKWPAITAASLFQELPAIRANALADRKARLAVSTYHTAGEVLMWFMQHIDADKTYSVSYVSTASSYIGNHLLAKLSEATLSELNKTRLYRTLYMPMQADYALSTIKGVISVLKTAFARAYELGLIARNPIADITFSSFTTTQPEAKPGKLKPHDLKALIKAINGQPTQKRVFFMTQLLHATRIGETSLAEWKQFSNAPLEWSIPEENTKNNTEHRLPITQHAYDLIHTLPKRGDYIFSSNGDKPYAIRTLERWYQSLSDEVGIKFTSHDIRKLARDCWQDMGIDWVIGEMLLNHERDGLDKRYMHAHSREQMKRALGEWGDVFCVCSVI
ncbi:site-specific integrase [Marinomonas mediterranea]|jgi:Phage integrase family.|uniref:Integrase family protein n=1 Tax=Marinomonas mediterranea (strain ATCC 700492 / JCM 21426 / NBRC 103028 / MMB-1) TaxID=717774 RepID=F2K1E8_MARM1|nr:site-specific integrase [Marinomonas mediterranea]ADZ91079.1 integrase family protein [Marinomonas mediterranea MMB-1]WCN17214.1 tyrosine-type recombinase/integrase [Marinomonas mediterranea MMB-1]